MSCELKPDVLYFITKNDAAMGLLETQVYGKLHAFQSRVLQKADSQLPIKS